MEILGYLHLLAVLSFLIAHSLLQRLVVFVYMIFPFKGFMDYLFLHSQTLQQTFSYHLGLAEEKSETNRNALRPNMGLRREKTSMAA